MAEKKLKILTIRPSDDEEKEAIRYVMRESGCRTAAQAMIFACNAYRMNNERKKTFIDDIREKNKKNNLRQQQMVLDETHIFSMFPNTYFLPLALN